MRHTSPVVSSSFFTLRHPSARKALTSAARSGVSDTLISCNPISEKR